MSNDTRPEIRFPGFTDDWEQRKLASMTNYKNGKGHEDKQSTIGKLELINLNSISISGGLKHSGKFIDEADDTLQKDDLVMILSDVGHGDLLGRVALIPEDDRFVLNQRVALLRPNATADPQFLFSYINAHQYYFKAQGAGMSQLNISKGSVENFISFVPIIEEQKKIGTFFKQIDNTITLHQRKLDLLKETKKGFLQKMFPKNGAKVPEIRFPGFTEDWEQRKLGEVVERVTRKNKKLESIRPLTISAQEGLIDQNEFFNKTVASRDVSGYYLVKKGEFAYNKSYSNGYPWGAVKRLNQYDMGVLSTLYIVFKPKKIDSDFLEKYYDTTYWYKEVSKHAAEGARNHGLLNIAASDFFETEIVMPLKIEEQQKIGAFFKQLDDTIALHQRELDVLKETKKGFLQKMFV